ncbi:MAG: aldehyde dehydrogenase family protein, partial [Actinomycetota bacterium]|nr:aldehyde dehydrogenase family protein [Actinomycetota bacterium]
MPPTSSCRRSTRWSPTGSGSVASSVSEVVDPSTGRAVATVAQLDAPGADAAIEAAHAAFAEWRRVSPADRGLL